MARAIQRRGYGRLEFFELPSDRDAVTVVLLHGYGANGADLVPLAAELPCRLARPRWLFPEAPETLASAPGAASRAWFPIDEESLLRVRTTGTPMGFAGEDPPELRKSAEALAEALADAGAAPGRTVLGGFSQGAVVALETAFLFTTPPAGLALLSGNLVAEDRWRRLAPRLAGVPFFQSHGRADPLLGFEGARSLEVVLREAGLKGSLMPFDGGHCIPAEVVLALAQFLDGLKSG